MVDRHSNQDAIFRLSHARWQSCRNSVLSGRLMRFISNLSDQNWKNVPHEYSQTHREIFVFNKQHAHRNEESFVFVENRIDWREKKNGIYEKYNMCVWGETVIFF